MHYAELIKTNYKTPGVVLSELSNRLEFIAISAYYVCASENSTNLSFSEGVCAQFIGRYYVVQYTLSKNMHITSVLRELGHDTLVRVLKDVGEFIAF